MGFGANFKLFINQKGIVMNTILLVILILLLLGALPVYPYSRNWGYAPSGTLIVVVVLLLLLL